MKCIKKEGKSSVNKKGVTDEEKLLNDEEKLLTDEGKLLCKSKLLCKIVVQVICY